MSKFSIDTYVRKRSGAFWEGTVVGHYNTEQTPDGVAVQLFGWPNGPVQIYPAAALELCPEAGTMHSRCPQLGASFETIAAAYAQDERAALGIEAAFLAGARFGAMRAANEFMAAQRVMINLSDEELEAFQKEGVGHQPRAIIPLAPSETLIFTPPPSTHVAPLTTEQIAEIIYAEALGHDPVEKSVLASGATYGAWANALKAAAVISAALPPAPSQHVRTVAELPMTAFADAAPQRDELNGEQTILTYNSNAAIWDLAFFESGEEFPDRWLGDTHWIDISGMWPGVIAQVASFATTEGSAE